jgi:hypothetical protein
MKIGKWLFSRTNLRNVIENLFSREKNPKTQVYRPQPLFSGKYPPAALLMAYLTSIGVVYDAMVSAQAIC